MGKDISELLGKPDQLRQRILELQREERFVKRLLKVTLQARGELPLGHGNRRDICAQKT